MQQGPEPEEILRGGAREDCLQGTGHHLVLPHQLVAKHTQTIGHTVEAAKNNNKQTNK